MVTKKIDISEVLISPPLSERLKAGCTLLKAGEAVGQHTTENREEVLVILQGTAHVMIGQETQEVKQGHLIFIPKNQSHNVLNKTEEILKYVYIVTPVASE